MNPDLKLLGTDDPAALRSVPASVLLAEEGLTSLIVGAADITSEGMAMDFAPPDTPRPFPENVDPKHGLPATWRGTTCVDFATGTRIGFSLNTERGVARFVLSLDCAKDLAETLGDYMRRHRERKSQSPISEGSPSAAVSTPPEGLKV